MNRSKIEQATASLAVTFLSITTFGIIILIADSIFAWNIFSPQVEKTLGFILTSMCLIIFSSVIVNIMINVSIIATAAKKLLNKK